MFIFMKTSKKPNLETVIRFLNFWDPMDMVEDLVSNNLVPNEYDSYAGRVFMLLENGITATLLLEELKRIQTQEMDRHFDFEKANLIAESLVHSFKEQSHRYYLD